MSVDGQLGVLARAAREEKTRARDAKAKARGEQTKQEVEHNEKMVRLYREVVLEENTPMAESEFLPLTALGGNAPAPKLEVEVEKTVSGD
jgi:hypothetical protein